MSYVFQYGTSENPEKKYYYRFRRGDFGAFDRALTTRYAYTLGRRPVAGKRGGTAFQEFPRFAYYVGGRFYRHVNTSSDGETWADGYAPITGTLFDAHPKQTAAEGLPAYRFQVIDGYPVHVWVDGESFDVTPEVWSFIESDTKLDKKPRKSPSRAA